ncbi:2-oxoglutarate dehydrogenase E2 component (dihydrolipoamide succinyltransferase) [Pustulibacterium marinum]|uniref:Dihydrolipoamide acetyltransferase component of pyruvate dehydrogenase complex n=1 Tax=Pustulibacterium marinum TaxID=1224947 RepID=A0A1I7F9U1_9FLAO|nr:dihydrolipoamide acetyltransferase family protein [Pustulibacterium marinum]SFU32934.1 2-oxoglutarate dehydrogenase E2 component (dihydrolipoamide succinyltransferase) [Pustulibacterium marinum]
MAKFELKLPKMGESVAEATVTSWLKEVGDTIEADEAIVEVATDKVDSEVPSEVDGVLVEKFFEANDVVKVGEVLGIIEIEGDGENAATRTEQVAVEENQEEPEEVAALEASFASAKESIQVPTEDFSETERFYSPLVKNIAKEEGISLSELEQVNGTGKDGRVTKNDILEYLENKKNGVVEQKPVQKETPVAPISKSVAPKSVNGDSEVVEMSRMGKIIADHMKESLQTSAHVQSFIEVDVTNIWNWRNKHKDAFQKREGEKLTFTPIFMEAIAKALKDFPMMNISMDGDKIIKHKNVNLGMAAALPDGNLIVPVIKNADQLNMVGMAKVVNDLADRARKNQLKPDEIKDGTYTVTNIGMFGAVMGTPIINQPQVGILALGAIRKVPAVIETKDGDFIGIRMKMFLSHSYDHRVVNGALGSQFAKAVADNLENFDPNREV